jgi:hypothetical protein
MKPSRESLSQLKYVLDNYGKPGLRHQLYFPEYGMVTEVSKNNRSEYFLDTRNYGNELYTIRLRMSHLEIDRHRLWFRDPNTNRLAELKVFVDTLIW